MCPKANPALTLVLMQEIDRAFTEWPFLGVRQMRDYLVLLGYSVGRKRVRRLMRLMGLMAVYQKPKTSIPHQSIRATRISCGDCPYQAQSGLVRGYHVHPHAQRIFVPGGRYGLAQ